MKRLLLMVFLVACLLGCSGPGGDGVSGQSWDSIVSQARGSMVRFYMQGDHPRAAQWLDGYAALELKRRYDITLVRVPLDTTTSVAKLVQEKDAGITVGGMDLLWLGSGEFCSAREKELLYGPFSDALPNFITHVDKSQSAYDFGCPVEGYEVPLGRDQFVFEYVPDRGGQPLRSYVDLKGWVGEHPGRFTYPAPPDPTGVAFVSQLFYDLTGGPKQYLEGWDASLFDKAAPKVWAYLRQLAPGLWHGGREYPHDSRELDALFAAGELDLGMAFGPRHASMQVARGGYPESVRTFVTAEGTLYRMHFAAIPRTASNKAGALVAINFLLSPEAQYSKYLPANWGDYPAIDLDTLDKKEWDRFAAVDHGKSALAPSILAEAGVPELPVEYVRALVHGWRENVGGSR